MNTRGLQLLEELKSVPNFDVSVLEQDLDAINHNWESSSKVRLVQYAHPYVISLYVCPTVSS